MAVLSILPVRVGQVGVQPNTYKMVSTANLATITTAGYFQQYTGGVFLANNDVIETIYLAGTLAPLNTLLLVSVNASTGIVTLSLQVTAELGTVANKAASNNANPVVASISAGNPPVSGTIATFIDNNGTVGRSSQNLTANSIAGSILGSTILVPDTNCTSASVVCASIAASGNPVNILSIVPNNGNFRVNFSAAPNTFTLIYLILKQQ